MTKLKEKEESGKDQAVSGKTGKKRLGKLTKSKKRVSTQKAKSKVNKKPSRRKTQQKSKQLTKLPQEKSRHDDNLSVLRNDVNITEAADIRQVDSIPEEQIEDSSPKEVKNSSKPVHNSDFAGEEPAELHLVCFVLGKEEYGLDIKDIHEINRVSDITVIPESPPYVKGIMNLRGRIIPVIDLRLCLGMPSKELTKSTRIIVLDGQNSTGILVDSVTEVLRVADTRLEKVPAQILSSGAEFLRGAFKREEKLIIVIDSNRIISCYT